MQDMQDMMRRLNQSGKRLSKGHRKIAEYIVEHYDKAVFMTASKLGEKVGVSESTVVRSVLWHPAVRSRKSKTSALTVTI